MLQRLTAREQLALLAEHFEPILREAFLESIESIRSEIVLKEIVERLERGDVGGAIDALHLQAAAFRPLERVISEAFEGGGSAVIAALPALRDPNGGHAVIRFDVRDPVAEAYLRDRSSTLITDIILETRDEARRIMEEGMRAGQNPTQTAYDIAGRVDSRTGRREGGILGLTNDQAGAVARGRQRLLSGDPREMARVLKMTRRDKRFDRTILKAIEAGKPLPQAFVDKWAGRYSDRLLKLRADTIARTETLSAMHQSKWLAYNQAIASGSLHPDDVVKIWRSAPATQEARPQHQAMQGQQVKFLEKFTAPDGTQFDFPVDPKAPASHTINCRCDWDVRIDFISARRRRNA